MRCQKTFTIWVLFLVVSGIGSLAAREANWQPETDGWEYIREVDDVELYRKPVEGSSFPALLAHTRIKASAREIFDVIADYKHFTDFIPSLTESRVLETSGLTSWVYQRLQFPMFVVDRHYVIRVEDQMNLEPVGVIHVDWQLDEERNRLLTADGVVLPRVFAGSWHLVEDTIGSTCDAVYSIRVEPGGKLPAWLFNRAAENYVLDVVEAVRERVSRM